MAQTDRADVESEALGEGQINRLAVAAAAIALLATSLWAYAPTLAQWVDVWSTQDDYSHGFLVVPLALFILWMRKESFPADSVRFAWSGLTLIALSVVLRLAGQMMYVDALDGWSFLLWVAGAVWLLLGPAVFRWSLPALGFLIFMVPMPFSVDHYLSVPLQRIATKISVWTLQLFGQPAIAEGNIILLDENELEVARACSGLRIFFGVIALAYVYLVLTRRLWWERVLLVLSIIPVALVANASRIVVTGLLYQYTTGDAARHFSHDIAGYLMIPLAAILFGLVLWYLGKLTREIRLVDTKRVIRGPRGGGPPADLAANP